MNHGKRVKFFRTISALSLLVASAGVSRVLLAVEGENGVSIDKSLSTQKSGGISRKNDTYFIKSETYGKTAGKNVFFSFDKFAIGSKETALFYCDSCPDARNVISRLTGAEKATINGTVRSGIGRNFYLLSPNGMVFGENAVIDVPGVTHLSTAGSLEFGNGSFQADQSRQKENVSTLTGDPRQFGFLSDKALQVNSLNVVNGGLDLAANQVELSGTLSVSPTAGDLQIVGNRIIVTGLIDSQSKRGDIRILAANTSLANPATHDDPLNSDIGRITLNEGGVLQASNGGTLIMGSGTIPSVGRDGKSSIDWPGFTAFSQHEPDNAFSVRSFESGLISLSGGGSVVLNNGIDNPNQANLLAANTLLLDSGFILDGSSNPLTLESRVRDVSLYGQTQIRKTAGSELLLKSARSVQILDKAELLHDSANSNTLIASIDGTFVNGSVRTPGGTLMVEGGIDRSDAESYSGTMTAGTGVEVSGLLKTGDLVTNQGDVTITGTGTIHAERTVRSESGNLTIARAGVLQSPLLAANNHVVISGTGSTDKTLARQGTVTIAKGGTLTAQESVTAEQADITAAGTLTTGELLAARNLDVSGTTTVEKSTTTEQGNVTVSGLLQSPEVTAKTGNINIAGTLKTTELDSKNISIDKGLLTNAIPNAETGVTIQAEKITLESIKVSDKLPQSFDDAKQYGGMYFDNAGTVTIISDNIEGKQIKEESKDSPLNGNRAYIFSFNDKDIFFSNKTKITQPGQSGLIISNSSIWKGKNKEENSGDIIFGDDKNKTNKVSLLDTHVLNYGRGENSSNNNVLFKLTGTTPEIIMGHSVVETRTDPEGQGGLINVSVPVETNYIYKDRTGQKTGRGGWIAAEPDSDLLDFYTRRSDYSNPASTLSLFASREYDKIDIAITSRTPSLQATGLSVIAPAPVKIDLDDVSSNPCDKAGSSLSWHGLGQYTPEQTLILPSQSSAQAINTVNHSEDNHSSIMSAYRLTQDTLWQASDAINLSTSQLEDAASKLQATSNDCDQHANLFN